MTIKEKYKLYRSYGHEPVAAFMIAVPFPVLLMVGVLIGIVGLNLMCIGALLLAKG